MSDFNETKLFEAFDKKGKASKPKPKQQIPEIDNTSVDDTVIEKIGKKVKEVAKKVVKKKPTTEDKKEVSQKLADAEKNQVTNQELVDSAEEVFAKVDDRVDLENSENREKVEQALDVIPNTEDVKVVPTTSGGVSFLGITPLPDIFESLEKVLFKKQIRKRRTDARIIELLNSKKLKNFNLKLDTNGYRCVTFKPFKSSPIKVRKATRVIISYESDKSFIMYYQESRNYSIVRLDYAFYRPAGSHILIQEEFLEQVSLAVLNFFKQGFETTKFKLSLRNSENTKFMDIITSSLQYAYDDYKMKLKVDIKTLSPKNPEISSTIFSIDSKDSKYNWLKLWLTKEDADRFGLSLLVDSKISDKTSELIKKYDIVIPNADKSAQGNYYWKDLIRRKDGLATLLYEIYFVTKWDDVLDISDDVVIDDNTTDDVKVKLVENRIEKMEVMKSAITSKPVKKAYQKLLDVIEETPKTAEDHILDDNFNIGKILSKRFYLDNLHVLGEGFSGETIYGKFAISYLRIPILNSDKRASKSHITSKAYYDYLTKEGFIPDKESKVSRKDYDERKRALGYKEYVKAGSPEGKTASDFSRNYHSNIYAYRLEYVDKKHPVDNPYIFISKDFDKVMETNFYGKKPKFIESELPINSLYAYSKDIATGGLYVK